MTLPVIGTEFAGYRIEELIGRGGMGVVYRATQLRLDRRVALKLILPELADDANFRHRFERECRMAASIDHPNVIPIYEADDVDGELFVSMRYVDGLDLGQLIARHGRLEPRRAVRIVAQVAEALDAAHSNELVHRDVKPANVLIEGGGLGGRVYLTDFGLAKRVSSKTGLTRTRQFVGTIDYTAPEQITGGAIDYRADLYALGCLVHHVLTGHVPFERETDMAALWAHVNDPPPSVHTLVSELPRELDHVVARAMAKRPEDRYRSAGDLAAAASAAAEGKRVTVRERTVARGAAISESAPVASPPAAASTMLEDSEGWEPAAPFRATRSAVEVPEAVRLATAAAEFPVPDMAPPAPAVRTRQPAVVPAALVGVGAAIAAGAMFVVGGLVSGDSNVELTHSASAGTVQLDFPAGWRVPERIPQIPGIRFLDPIARAPAGAPDGEALVAGRVDSGGPPLLPKAFLKGLRAEPRRDDPVLLGSVPAYRYRDVRPRGFGRSLTLYVAPTTRGVVTIACQAPRPRESGFMPGCERAAGSLKLVGDAKAFSLRPGGGYAHTLDSTMGRLNAARARSLPALRNARTNIGQASSAAAVGQAYSRAARTLAAGTFSPAARDANSAIVQAMRRAASSWTQLADTARLADAGGYRRARAAASAADASVRQSLELLGPLGYQVR